MKTDTIGHFDHQSSGNESDTILPIRVAFTTISEVENGRSNLRLNRLINVEVDISTLSHKKIWVLTVICMQIMKFYFLIIKNPTFIRVLTPKICFAVPLTKNFCFTIPNAYLLRGGVRIFQGVGGAKLQFRKGECQRTRLRQRSNANAYLVFLPPSKSAHDSRKVEF